MQVETRFYEKTSEANSVKGGNLEPNWTGPLAIAALQNKSAELKSTNSFLQKVNTDQLSIFKEHQPRIHINIALKKQPGNRETIKPTTKLAARLFEEEGPDSGAQHPANIPPPTHEQPGTEKPSNLQLA